LFAVLVKQKREVTRLLARLIVKGNFIWSEKDPDLYLDGEVFGTAAKGGAVTAIKLPSGDNRRGGDLEMWFWLVEGRTTDVKVTIKPETATVAPDKQVEFTVAVEGTTDKKVDVVLDPPTRAGTIEQAPQRPNTWIYTAPLPALVTQVKVVATSNLASEPATAVVTIVPGAQDIAVSIAVEQPLLEPLAQTDVTVTVQGGDASKVAMSVNGIPNGNDRVGTLKLKSPGVWTYVAPPRNQKVTIRATSQEDATKFDEAEVTIGRLNPPDRDASPGRRTRRPRT
jgi:hypothetical protein